MVDYIIDLSTSCSLDVEPPARLRGCVSRFIRVYVENTSMDRPLPSRYFDMGSTGQHYARIQSSMPKGVIGVRNSLEYYNGQQSP